MNSMFRIEPLNKENYDSWRIQVQAILIKNDGWKYASGKVPKPSEIGEAKNWEAEDEKAKADLILSMCGAELRHIRGCNTSREVWLKLESIYASKGPAKKATLLKRLMMHKMSETGDVRDHLNRFFDAVDKLAEMSIHINDDLLSIMLLYSLPGKFESFRCAIESRDELPKPEALKIKILEEHESREMNRSQNEDAMHTYWKKGIKKCNKSAKVANKNNPTTSGEGFKYKCFKCHEQGHKASECPNKKKVLRKDVIAHHVDVDEALITFNVSDLEVCDAVNAQKDDWIFDSGCTSHLCNDANMFEGTLTVTSGELNLATHVSTEIKGKGIVRLSACNKHSKTTIDLCDTLYVPKLRTNLISVAKLTNDGCEVTFKHNVANVIDKQGSIKLSAHRKGNLYCLNRSEYSFSLSNANVDIRSWHERLGHLNGKDVYKLLTKLGVKIDATEVQSLHDCDICAKGKMTALPFSNSGGPCAEKLKIIHSDIVGPMRCESVGGAKYFITFIDDCTRWCEVYFLSAKNKALDAFKAYKSQVENLTGLKVKYLQSDNGGEYCNAEFDNFLKQVGIMRRLTVARTPQQNGISERMNRTLVEMARCMLLSSDLSAGFWADAVDTACYIRNRCPTSSLHGDIPYERWLEKPVKIDYIRKFGAKVHILNKDPNKDKFTARGIFGIFVGYPKNARGYRVWIPEQRKFMVARDVRFHENRYSSHEISTQEPGPSNVKEDIDKEFIEIEFSKCTLPEVRDNQVQQEDDEIWSECQEYSEESRGYEQDEVTNPPNIDHHLEESRTLGARKQINQQRMMKRAPGRPKILRTGSAGRPRKMYQMTEVKQSINTDSNDAADFVGSAEMSLKNALKYDDKPEWEEAILSEIKSLVQKGTWEIVKKPKNRNIIGCRYVLTTKQNVDKTFKKKARLVAQGFSQRYGVDYEKTFAPVARLDTVRLLMALAVELDLEIHQLDINTAYLNGSLDEEIYMEVPELLKESLIKLMNREGEDPMVKKHAQVMLSKLDDGCDSCLLRKSLYGLKQAGRQWNLRLNKKLTEMGLKQSLNEPCLYFKQNGNTFLFVLIYVDDILIGSQERGLIIDFKNELSKEFDLKDYGQAKYILGIDIKRNDNVIALSQENYIRKMLEKFNMENCNKCATPMEINSKVKSEEKCDTEKDETWPYRELIGCLNYLSNATRPDIANAVSKLSQKLTKPETCDWKSAKRILRYLKGTMRHSLVYKKTGDCVQGFSDADWANCVLDRRSYSGYAFILGGACVSWQSRKQRSVATSTCEAEYVSLSECIKEAVYLNSLMRELGIVRYTRVVVHADNQGAICLAQDPMFHARSKHIDIRYHYIREVLRDNTDIQLRHVPTESMLADVLTKPLCSVKHYKCITGLGVKDD